MICTTTHRYGVYMIYKESNSRALFWTNVLSILAPFLHQFMVKFDQEQCLIFDSSEEVILSYKIENVRSAKTDKVRQCLARLSIGCVPVNGLVSKKVDILGYSQFGKTFHKKDGIRVGN